VEGQNNFFTRISFALIYQITKVWFS